MKLAKLIEKKEYDKDHVCKTPGAIYSTKLKDDGLSIHVSLPKGIKTPDSEVDSLELEVDLHYAIEKVLQRLFKRKT
jgi:hypothetical protein